MLLAARWSPPSTCYKLIFSQGHMLIDIRILEYADLRPNKAICTLYADEMASFDTPVDCNLENLVAGAGSTDQGMFT